MRLIASAHRLLQKIVANSWIRQTKPTKKELIAVSCTCLLAPASAATSPHCLSQIIDQGIYSSSTKHLAFTERCQLLARQLLKRIQIDILGLIPLHSEHQCYPSNEKTGHAFELLRVRNRFGDPRPIGGYRDINLKLRIGFMVMCKPDVYNTCILIFAFDFKCLRFTLFESLQGDIKSANPLFCPV